MRKTSIFLIVMMIEFHFGQCQDSRENSTRTKRESARKTSRRARLFFALLSAVFTLFLSCEEDNTKIELNPPTTDPLVRDFLGYGVVTESFTHIRETPENSSISLGHIRKGSMVKIIERRTINTRGSPGIWLRVEYSGTAKLSGWLNEELLDIYDNESRALTASEIMTP